MEKQRKHNWRRSAAINTVILIAVILGTHMIYETNDDYAIASRIADGYAIVNFVNYYLCRILVAVQQMIPSLNAYVIAQIGCSWIALTCILKLIMDASDRKWIHLVAVMTIAIFSVDHYCTIQFTKTAALLIITGLMLITDSITNKRHAGYYIAGVLLLYTGVGFRIDGLIAAIGFTGLYMLKWLIDNRRILIEGGYFRPIKVLLYILLAVIVGGCYGFEQMSYNVNVGTEELKTYKAYSELRSDFVDYPLYEYYEDNAAAYEDAGFSENDLNLIDHWYFDYDGAASAENLEKIIAIDRANERSAYTITQAVKKFIKETKQSVIGLDFTGIHLILLLFLAVWMIISLRPRYWLYIIAIGGLVACMYLALYYMQRPEYRALYIADIGASMWLLYSMAVSAGGTEDRNNVNGRSPIAILAVVICIAVAMLAVPLHRDCQSSYNKVSKKVMPAELAEYMAENDDIFFVFGTQEKKSSASYITPWLPADTYTDRNCMGTGSWGTMSPYVLNKLAAYGLSNPIKDLINNEKACYVGNKRIKRLTEYYNKWYAGDGETIKLIQVTSKGGFDIWKVIKETNG